MPIAEIILALIKAAPSAIVEVTQLYTAIKADLSETDQATIDQALADAIAADAQATAAADTALDEAAKR